LKKYQFFGKRNKNKLLNFISSFGIEIAFFNKLYADKAKLRVIGGRLPAIIGGGPTVPEMEQAGKATDPKFSGRPGCRSTCLPVGREENFSGSVVYSSNGLFFFEMKVPTEVGTVVLTNLS
jgi:hypothetical protein